MKCLYYLTPFLESTRKINEDLHQNCVKHWFVHVLSKDENGLQRYKIHSSNYLEQLDTLRYGMIGAIAGIVFGGLVALFVDWTKLFSTKMTHNAYIGVIVFFILFGAWEGGLTGIAKENRKVALFHNELEAGAYLILIYTKKDCEAIVKELMDSQHPEAKLVAIDASFYNPLAKLQKL